MVGDLVDSQQMLCNVLIIFISDAYNDIVYNIMIMFLTFSHSVISDSTFDGNDNQSSMSSVLLSSSSEEGDLF